MLKKALSIAGLLAVMALVPSGAFARDRDDWHGRRDYDRHEYRERRGWGGYYVAPYVRPYYVPAPVYVAPRPFYRARGYYDAYGYWHPYRY